MPKGFTLIELLAVVLIISILTSVALPQYRKSLERSKAAEARQMLPALHDACERLVTESLCNSWTECSDKLRFANLDMEMKGEANGNYWYTKNFKYAIHPTTAKVSAQRTGGRWQNFKIIYDGDSFTCSSSSVSSAYRDQVCKLLDFSVTDSGE